MDELLYYLKVMGAPPLWMDYSQLKKGFDFDLFLFLLCLCDAFHMLWCSKKALTSVSFSDLDRLASTTVRNKFLFFNNYSASAILLKQHKMD
jgi:hypothetical protein